MTNAGGAATMDDVRLAQHVSGGALDLTVGSALDIFGRRGVRYAELVAWNARA